MSSGWMGTGSPMVTPVSGTSGQLSWAATSTRDMRETARNGVDSIVMGLNESVKFGCVPDCTEWLGYKLECARTYEITYVFSLNV